MRKAIETIIERRGAIAARAMRQGKPLVLVALHVFAPDDRRAAGIKAPWLWCPPTPEAVANDETD